MSVDVIAGLDISIHALHEESDWHYELPYLHGSISIHALHEESDRNKLSPLFFRTVFQSTLSMRRATAPKATLCGLSVFQSTLSMRRATNKLGTSNRNAIFQSTLSMRRATKCLLIHGDFLRISIHALHEESDPRHKHQAENTAISIHALHEESDSNQQTMQLADIFQSTLSMRRATTAAAKPDTCNRYFNPRSP